MVCNKLPMESTLQLRSDICTHPIKSHEPVLHFQTSPQPLKLQSTCPPPLPNPRSQQSFQSQTDLYFLKLYIHGTIRQEYFGKLVFPTYRPHRNGSSKHLPQLPPCQPPYGTYKARLCSEHHHGQWRRQLHQEEER